jgi:hypothetical protein
MPDPSAAAGEALVAYWRGSGALGMRERELCRRLTELLGGHDQGALSGLVSDGAPGHTERAAAAVREAARADPAAFDLADALARARPAEGARGAAQSVSVNGSHNAVLTVGGSVYGSNLSVGPSAAPAAPTRETASELVILFAAAEPTEQARLRLGEEFREVREALDLSPMKDRVSLQMWPSVRPKDFTRAVLQLRPWVIHFSGHGTGTGELCFEDDGGRELLLAPEALSAFFEVVGRGVKCVVLNACYAERQARAIAEHVSWVVGMNDRIEDRAAISFSIGFYQALGAGKDIPEAFALGRSMIRMYCTDGATVPVLIPGPA